jgi:hypothetical protein
MGLSEKRISDLVGLQTYIALHHRWPELYKPIHSPMYALSVYLELVDTIAASSSYSNVGDSIRADLVRLVNLGYTATNKPTDYSIASRLVGSSTVISYLKSDPSTVTLFIFVVAIFSFVITTLLCFSGIFTHPVLPFAILKNGQFL